MLPQAIGNTQYGAEPPAILATQSADRQVAFGKVEAVCTSQKLRCHSHQTGNVADIGGLMWLSARQAASARGVEQVEFVLAAGRRTDQYVSPEQGAVSVTGSMHAPDVVAKGPDQLSTAAKPQACRPA